jgi:hypothetical protein
MNLQWDNRMKTLHSALFEILSIQNAFPAVQAAVLQRQSRRDFAMPLLELIPVDQSDSQLHFAV